MTLGQYLAERRLTPLEFAQRIGVSDESVRRYVRSVRRPAPEVMTRIARQTRGQVTANDFYDMPGRAKTFGTWRLKRRAGRSSVWERRSD